VISASGFSLSFSFFVHLNPFSYRSYRIIIARFFGNCSVLILRLVIWLVDLVGWIHSFILYCSFVSFLEERLKALEIDEWDQTGITGSVF